MWKRLKANIDKTLLGATTLIIFFIVQFLWYVLKPTYMVPMWIVMLLFILFYICCVILYAAGKTRNTEVLYKLPSVRTVTTYNDKIILVVEKNELFSLHSLVTIYQQEEEGDLEIALGVGVVETINSQGNMQVVFIEVFEEERVKKTFHSGLLGRKNIWNSIYIKPTISQESFERRDRNE